MKRTILCALLCALALGSSARAAARTVPVQVDGTPLEAACRLEDGVTYVPLRALLNAFGGWEVFWNGQTRTAEAVSERVHLSADPAADTIQVDGTVLPGRVTVENGRTYVPLRLVAEALGGRVVWDPRLQGAAVTSPGADCDAEDLYWLSRVISAESCGEPFRGQIAVGNVVLNRVASEEFPDSIPAVVFDRRGAVQFEPVDNGTIWHAPAASSIEAAKQVLNGENVVGDALYFYAPALSPGTWIHEHRRYSMTIGGHRFYH